MANWSLVAQRIRVPLGFAFAVFYIWLARPTWLSIIIGVIIAIPGIVLRALASGHVKKNQELTTTGPYAYVRNPLYVGSLIMALGFAVARSRRLAPRGTERRTAALRPPGLCTR